MYLNWTLAWVALVAFAACDKKKTFEGTPDCVQALINDIKSEEVWNPPAKVFRYQYDGKTVYYFSAACCDITSTLYDENCVVICAPDGGISGQGDFQCTDFNDLKTDEELVWEDNR